jgi:hypothetical protein
LPSPTSKGKGATTPESPVEQPNDFRCSSGTAGAGQAKKNITQVIVEKIPLTLLSIFPLHVVVIAVINLRCRPGIKTGTKEVGLVLFFYIRVRVNDSVFSGADYRN